MILFIYLFKYLLIYLVGCLYWLFNLYFKFFCIKKHNKTICTPDMFRRKKTHAGKITIQYILFLLRIHMYRRNLLLFCFSVNHCFLFCHLSFDTKKSTSDEINALCPCPHANYLLPPTLLPFSPSPTRRSSIQFNHYWNPWSKQHAPNSLIAFVW